MKLYLSHSSNYDYQTELYEPLKTGLKAEHEIFFPHDEHNEGVLSRTVIPACDLVVAEVSYPSTGQGIELGWASAAAIPIICFHDSDAKPSTAIRFISDRIISYENTRDMVEKLKAELESI